MVFFAVSSSSLTYDNIKESAPLIFVDFLQDDVNATSAIDENYNLIQLYCANNPGQNYVFRDSNSTFDIPCSSVSEGKDAMVQEAVKSLIYDVYYTKYDCSFFDCLKESPFFLISEGAYIYLNSKFYFFLLISFVLTAGLFFFIEKKTNTFIIAGSLMIISSLIFVGLDSVMTLLSDKMLFKLLGIFFSEAFSVSAIIFIAGIILLAIGIISKIFKIGFKIQEIISKFKKKPEIKGKQPAKNIQSKKKSVKRKY